MSTRALIGVGIGLTGATGIIQVEPEWLQLDEIQSTQAYQSHRADQKNTQLEYDLQRVSNRRIHGDAAGSTGAVLGVEWVGIVKRHGAGRDSLRLLETMVVDLKGWQATLVHLYPKILR